MSSFLNSIREQNSQTKGHDSQKFLNLVSSYFLLFGVNRHNFVIYYVYFAVFGVAFSAVLWNFWAAGLFRCNFMQNAYPKMQNSWHGELIHYETQMLLIRGLGFGGVLVLAKFISRILSTPVKSPRPAKHTIGCASKSEYRISEFHIQPWSERRAMAKTVAKPIRF